MDNIIFIVNKWWECEPILFSVLNHYVLQPATPRIPDIINYPVFRPDPEHLPLETDPKPRLGFINKNKDRSIEIYCISDLLTHLPDDTNYQSSSEQKAKYLPKIFKDKNPTLVIAVGTAGYPSQWSENGSVVIGTKVFMHNYHPNGENPFSDWRKGPFDKVLTSSINQKFFDDIISGLVNYPQKLSDCFFTPPLNPSVSPKIISSFNAVDLLTINVTNYNEMEKADLATLQAFKNSGSTDNPLSSETTHGLIAVQTEAPFLFISGMTDRVGYFSQEVTPRKYAQNSVVSHNMGVVISRLIDFLYKY